MPEAMSIPTPARSRTVRRVLLALAVLLGTASTTEAAVTPPWSTTFDCPAIDVCAAPNGSDICDGLERGLTSPLNTSVGSEANFVGGGGGSGLVRDIGDGNTMDSVGPSGCDTSIDFESPTTEVWFRWHFSFEAGMPVNSDNGFGRHKLIFMHLISGSGRRFSDIDGGFTLVGGGANQTSSFNFDDFYDSGTSDGTWHGVEVHIDTSTNLFEAWVYKDNVDDPTPILSTSANSFGSPLRRIEFPSNFRTDFTGAKNGTTYHAYYDDLAVSASGRIGPVGGCPDADEDGAQDAACGGADCDDTNDAVGPSQAEVCDNGLDDDCDGMTDAADPMCRGGGESGSGESEGEASSGTESGGNASTTTMTTANSSSTDTTANSSSTDTTGTTGSTGSTGSIGSIGSTVTDDSSAGEMSGGEGCSFRGTGHLPPAWLFLLPVTGFVRRRFR